jgi:uncharacterized membrane protein
MAMASADNRQVLAGLGTLGSGVLSGLYFIFSFCVMGALNAQPPAVAIQTMNTSKPRHSPATSSRLARPRLSACNCGSVNTMIVNPPFLLVFMGTPLLCGYMLRNCVKEGLGSSAENSCTAAGAAVLLLGEFLLTLAVHIPKNNALAAHTVGSANDAVVWAEYFTSWTAWNHVRMAASMATTVLLSAALAVRERGGARPTQL